MSGMNDVSNLTQGRVAEEAGTAGAPTVSNLEPKVLIRDLKFYYGDSLALKSISVPLYAHKVTAFIGPSGCGKSTLLRVLNRMYDLYPNQRAEGEVILDGVNILRPEQDLNLLRARVGMVFQKPTPFQGRCRASERIPQPRRCAACARRARRHGSDPRCRAAGCAPRDRSRSPLCQPSHVGRKPHSSAMVAQNVVHDLVVLGAVSRPMHVDPIRSRIGLELVEILVETGERVLLDRRSERPKLLPFGNTVHLTVALLPKVPEPLVMHFLVARERR